MKDSIFAAVSAAANVALAWAAWSAYRWGKREFTLTRPLKIAIRWSATFYKVHKGEVGNLAMGFSVKGVTESPVKLHSISYAVFDIDSKSKGGSKNLIGRPIVFHSGHRIGIAVDNFRIDYVPHVGIPVATVVVNYRMSWDGVDWRHEDWYREFDITGSGLGKVSVTGDQPRRVAVYESSWWIRLTEALRKVRKELGGGWPA